MTDAKKTSRSTKPTDATADGFTDEERSAMKARAKEVRAASRGGSAADKAAAAEAEVVAKIAEMPEEDRALAEKVHSLVKAVTPELAPRLWYGMPAYAKDGKVLCFFKPASKFKARYATLGFSDVAGLDDGVMWPTEFALTGLGPAVEERIATLLKTAAN
ncbi:iron chaperone [Streptomyces sp. NPDC101115]|uniref:iron chaperone n=1 Tax=Streptomyces sp. NPDC101115 TaxID=3366106 RepID=UPI003830BEAE